MTPGASDATLLAAARGGSLGAFGVLYDRYRPYAVEVARAALPKADARYAEDVTEAAFASVLNAVRNGRGPTDTLRPYLATAVRRSAWETARKLRRSDEAHQSLAQATSDEPDIADGQFGDPADLNQHALIADAFDRLPKRWRSALWMSEVEGRKAGEVADLLGVSPATASAVLYRARRGLIAAYVSAYRDLVANADCRAPLDRINDYLVAGRPDSGFADVEAHLDGCRRCRDMIRGVDVLRPEMLAIGPVLILPPLLAAVANGAKVAGLIVMGRFGARFARLARGNRPARVAAASVVVVAAAVVAAAAAGWVQAPSDGLRVESAATDTEVPSTSGRSLTVPVETTAAPAPSSEPKVPVDQQPSAPPAQAIPRRNPPERTSTPTTTARPPAVTTTTRPSVTTTTVAATSTTTSTTRPTTPTTLPPTTTTTASTTTTTTTTAPAAVTSITGRVRDATSGTAVDVAGTQVAFTWLDGRGTVSTTTGADGSFELVVNGTGRGSITVWYPGPSGSVPYPVTILTVDGRPVSLGDIVFTLR